MQVQPSGAPQPAAAAPQPPAPAPKKPNPDPGKTWCKTAEVHRKQMEERARQKMGDNEFGKKLAEASAKRR